MAPDTTEPGRLPIYEDLVRERGDVVAEARLAAAHTQHRAAELLGGQYVFGDPVRRTAQPTG
ncbi:hypothetical protein [Streptomyces sp. NPDC091215]|uniref:hypothetical protein n=1 Tax=Streptomyces sp. NPDC091215 TaxID=3155192 RepID=UPI0034428448